MSSCHIHRSIPAVHVSLPQANNTSVLEMVNKDDATEAELLLASTVTSGNALSRCYYDGIDTSISQLTGQYGSMNHIQRVA